MRRKISALLLASALGGGCASAPGSAPAEPAAPNRGAAVAFELARVGGGTVSAASLHGEVVVLDFWASWCEPCKQAMPFLDQRQREHPDELVVVEVSVDEDEAAMMSALEARPAGFTVLHDPSGASASGAT